MNTEAWSTLMGTQNDENDSNDYLVSADSTWSPRLGSVSSPPCRSAVTLSPLPNSIGKSGCI